MKKTAIGLLACLVVLTVFGGEYREFTDAEGHSVKAKILEFNSSTGQLYLEREDGKRGWVNPGIFSEKDLPYIKEWIDADETLSPRNLRFSFQKRQVRDLNALGGPNLWDGESAPASQDEAVDYEITIQNVADRPVEGLKIEYRYLVRTIRSKAGEDKEFQIKGMFNPLAINGKDQAVLHTKELTLFRVFKKSSERIGYEGNNGRRTPVYQNRLHKISEQKLLGIWIKVYGPEVGGAPMVRDVFFPADLTGKYAWDDEAKSKQAEPGAARDLPGPETVDEYKVRGKARTQTQYNKWRSKLFNKKLYKMSREEMHIHELGFREFYDVTYDPEGFNANEMAYYCNKHALYPAAIHWYETAVPLMCEGKWHTQNEARIIRMFDRLAELYSSCSDASVHDGAKAIKYANLLLAKEKKSDQYLELLARGYARNGQFDLAVETQEEAIERLQKTRKDEDDLAEYQKRLELYQNEHPYTEPAE